MTDQEKLQKLFDAALKDGSEVNRKLTRVGPSTSSPAPRDPVQSAATAVMDAPAHSSTDVETAEPSGDFVKPMENAGLDHQTSDELAGLLDAKIARDARKHKRGRIITILFFVSITAGGAGWVAKSPERFNALCDALRDIRSVGDVKSMVAKFQSSLDKVAVRGQQIDQATQAMGVVDTGEDHEDAYFTEEMKGMMGEQGKNQKTVGERAAKLEAAFDTMRKENGVKNHEVKAQPKTDSAFLWEEPMPASR